MTPNWPGLALALSEDQGLFIDDAGQPRPDQRWQTDQPAAVMPGSFNPAHAGHWALAEAGARWTGLPVVFELSLTNVDKPPLSAAEIERRLAQFRGRVGVWLTKAPRFVHKARLFPGAVFIVGADTAKRIVAPAYHDQDETALRQALESVRAQRCRFLVAGRVNNAGQFLHLADLVVPSAFKELFESLPPDQFRLDLSSTQLRGR